MSTQINQITTEATSITDNSVMPIDTELTGVYTTQKTKWATIKTLVRSYILNIANTFTKQIKIISDGTNPPLVVRDSTDTTTMFEIDNMGSFAIRAPIGQYYPGFTLYNNGNNIQATLEGYNGIAWRSYAGMSFVYNGGSDVPNSVFSIGANWNVIPNYSSIAFAVTSTTKGVLLPRLTTTQRNAISSPATSLLIFNTTTNQYEWYNGTAWTSLGGGTTQLTGSYATMVGTSGTLGQSFIVTDLGQYFGEWYWDGFAWTRPNQKVVTSYSSVTTSLAAGQNTQYFHLLNGTNTLTLPTAVGNSSVYNLKLKSGSTNLNTTSSQTIDESSSITLNLINQSITLVSDGANWQIF